MIILNLVAKKYNYRLSPKGVSKADSLKLSKWKYPPSDVTYPGTGDDPNIDVFVNGVFTDEPLTKGKIIDRYGDNGSEKYFSPDGSSFGSRALPPFMKNKPYERLRRI